MPRAATESQVRAIIGYPNKGQDEEYYAHVSELIGKDYTGGDVSSDDVRELFRIWNAKNDDLNERHAKLREAQEERDNLPDFDALIAEHISNPNWNTITDVARKLGLDHYASTFNLLYQRGVNIVEIEPDGARVSQPSKDLRYGVWDADLDVFLEILAAEKAQRDKEQEDRFQAQVDRVNAVKEKDQIRKRRTAKTISNTGR